MLAILLNIANSSGDQAWLVPFSTVLVAGPNALPSDRYVHGIYCPMQLLKACQGLSSQQSQEPCSAAAALHLAIQKFRSTS